MKCSACGKTITARNSMKCSCGYDESTNYQLLPTLFPAVPAGVKLPKPAAVPPAPPQPKQAAVNTVFPAAPSGVKLPKPATIPPAPPQPKQAVVNTVFPAVPSGVKLPKPATVPPAPPRPKLPNANTTIISFRKDRNDFWLTVRLSKDRLTPGDTVYIQDQAQQRQGPFKVGGIRSTDPDGKSITETIPLKKAAVLINAPGLSLDPSANIQLLYYSK